MRKRKIIIIFILTLIVLIKNYAYSIPTTEGKEFWIAFPGSYYSKAQKRLYIISNETANVNVYIPALFFDKDYVVTPGIATIVNLPQDASIRNSNSFEYKGIHITSDKNIIVYGMSEDTTITDAYLSLPVNSLGTEYIIDSYYNSDIETSIGGTQFAVVGIEDNTDVTITLSEDTPPYQKDIPFSFILNEGEVFYLKNTVTSSDLSGSFISANKKIAVFGSHHCANIPVNKLYCDYLVEQLMPITSWGKEFIITPLAGRTNGDTYRFIASSNNTSIYLDGSLLTTLNKCEVYEVIIDGVGYITSNNRICVMQYSNSVTYDSPPDDKGDPFMLTIIPIEQYKSSYTIYSPLIGITKTATDNYINIVANNSDTGNVTLDGSLIGSNNFTPVSSSGYSVVRVKVSDGIHTIFSAMPIGVFVYGFNFRESYGYPGGANVIDFVSTKTPTVTLTETLTITLTPTKTTTPNIFFTRTTTLTDTPTLTTTIYKTTTITLTPTMTNTATPFTPSATSTFTSVFSPTMTCSMTKTFTMTFTETPALTFTQTITFSITLTPTLTLTLQPTLTPTVSFTMTNTFTITPTPIPFVLELNGNFPSPFKNSTYIVYYLSIPVDIFIKIYTVSGEKVIFKDNLKGKSGYNYFYWNGKNFKGKQVSSGVYIYKIIAIYNGREYYKIGKCVCVR